MKFSQFLVTVAHPKDVTIGELEEYIAVAVRQWAAGGDPDMPIHEVTDYQVRVRNADQGVPHKMKRPA